MKTSSIIKITKDMQKEIDLLLHELSPNLGKLDNERVNKLLEDGSLILYVCKTDDNEIAGMLTLTHCETLTSTKYWIEDVVVAQRFRGQGIGRALVQAAVQHVRSIDSESDCKVSKSIYLTSNPSRTAARNLYRSEGFEDYDTGVFRIKLR
jgi:ribosomal protein S18 acetylase RimI-like enzyme